MLLGKKKSKEKETTCIDFYLRPRKLYTPIKTRYVIFISFFDPLVLINTSLEILLKV